MKRPVIIRKEIDSLLGIRQSSYYLMKNNKEADIALISKLGKNYFKVAIRLDYYKEVSEAELFNHLKSLNKFKYYGTVSEIKAVRLIPADEDRTASSAYLIFDVDYNISLNI
tara:strand:+ start:1738 stop:2073 length:336 start_codon:yes stop_codon:yes gene_type:complete